MGVFSFQLSEVEAALSCSITTAALCTSPSTIVLRMSAASNAHAELPSQATANYASNVMCCTGVTGLANTCTNSFAIVAKLAAVTNSHVQQNTLSTYTNNACLSAPSGTMTVGYQATNCTGYDTTLGSLSGTTNAHIGNSASFTTQICARYLPAQSISFSLSTNTVGFGSLSTSASRYATADTLGSASEVEAHSLTVSSNASSGYVVTVKGATLTNGATTIAAIGGTNTAPSAGTEQFGLRINASGGTGAVTSPYAATGFAYGASASTASQVASESVGDGVVTTYSVRYLGNVKSSTASASYTTALTYSVTSSF